MGEIVRHERYATFYHRDTIKLARSLILKSYATAVAMNDQVDLYYISQSLPQRVDIHDLTTWRYFCHLAGEYHEYDIYTLRKPIEIRSLDTLQMIELTKENLQLHRATLQHYRSKGEYYIELIKRYPDYHLLIDGICNPIDKDVAIQAKDYEILYYDPTLVEPNEYYLIPELNQMIQKAVNRFHSRNYRVFIEGYDAIKLGILAMHIPGMIIAIREHYVGTPFVHNYHLWNYLGGNFNLDRFKDYLTKEQALYLYRHIRYIDINGGKSETFEKLIEVLLTWRGIPIHGFDVAYHDGHFSVSKDRLNFKDKTDRGEQINHIAELFDKELDLSKRNGDFLSHGLTSIHQLGDRSTSSRFPTKLLESEIIDYGSQDSIPIGVIATYYWAYLSVKNKYHLIIPITQPETGERFNLTAREGFILWFYITSRFLNPFEDRRLDDQFIPSFTCYNILREYVNWDRVRKNLVNKKIKVDKAIDSMQYHYPQYKLIHSLEGFVEFVEGIHEYRHGNLIVESHYHDLNLWGEVHHVNQYLLVHPTIPLVDEPITFGEYFKRNGWTYHTLDEEQLMDVAITLYRQFVGDYNKGKEKLADIQNAMLTILKQLTSYSVQYTSSIRGEDVRVIEYPQVRYSLEKSKTLGVGRITRLLSEVLEYRGKERSYTNLLDGMGFEESSNVNGSEYSRHYALPELTTSLSGLSRNYHEFELNNMHVFTGINSTPIKDVPKTKFHALDGVLHLFGSPHQELQPWFEIKQGLVPDVDRR